jgi:ATP-dependent exoDNAse (exonuclease V) alpha subunit
LGEYEEDNTGEKLGFKDKEARSIEYDLIKAFSMVVSTWGACLSTHKSQGSEFKKLILIDDGFGTWGDNAFETRRRWLYTSITRASEKLAIFHGRVA